MDPISAMAFSLIVSWVFVNAAWEAGVDQAKAEARHTADAIRKDLCQRRKAWAKQLEGRLADGRKGGPATALWWGWAALRTAKGVRRVMRREPRTAERAIGGTTGPFQRIFGAAWRGGKYARSEARRQREAHEASKPREKVGVCGRCGTIATQSALVWALTRFGRQERMCAACRAAVKAERDVDQENKAATSDPEPDAVDADVVHDTDEDTIPRTHDTSSARPSSGTSMPPRQVTPTPTVKVERVYESPKPSPAVSAAAAPAIEPVTTPETESAPEGEVMPRSLMPGKGGTLATRNHQMTRRGGGDSYTHGQWHTATTDIHRRLEMLPALLEQMLRSLNHADAGRSQVAGVMAFYEGAVLFMADVHDMLRIVGAKEKPMVDAVTTAGGPDEVPNMGYFREI